MEFPPQTLDQIRDLRSSARADAEHLKVASDQASQAEAFWVDLERFLVQGWAMHFLSLAEREAPRLKALKAADPSAVSAIEQATQLAREQSERELRRYPALLEHACATAGLHLDGNSRHPKYGLEGGFFLLEIDETKRVARLSDHEGRLAELPADVPAVVDALQREYKRVLGRPFSGPKVLKRLRGQYKAVLKRDQLSDGDSVPIRHITKRLGKNIKGFRTDEFLVDLSRLAREGPFEIDGRRLDLQHTKDINQGMLLLGSTSSGYVGFIVFKET